MEYLNPPMCECVHVWVHLETCLCKDQWSCPFSATLATIHACDFLLLSIQSLLRNNVLEQISCDKHHAEHYLQLLAWLLLWLMPQLHYFLLFCQVFEYCLLVMSRPCHIFCTCWWWLSHTLHCTGVYIMTFEYVFECDSFILIIVTCFIVKAYSQPGYLFLLFSPQKCFPTFIFTAVFVSVVFLWHIPHYVFHLGCSSMWFERSPWQQVECSATVQSQ